MSPGNPSIRLEIDANGNEARSIATRGGETWARLFEKTWDTEFFSRRIGAVELPPETRTRLAHDSGELLGALDGLFTWADENRFALLECQIDARWLRLVPFLEQRRFRLVDSRIMFLSLIEKKDNRRLNPDRGAFHMVEPGDLPGIHALTHEGFTHNPEFVSRYKNRDYYTETEIRSYYEAWIANTARDPASLFLVWKDEGRVVGYYIYKRIGEREGRPLFKGILATVAPEYRGKYALGAMQSFLFDQIPEPGFWVENVTQLGNMAVIRNHIRARRSLEHIGLLFYRTAPSR